MPSRTPSRARRMAYRGRGDVRNFLESNGLYWLAIIKLVRLLAWLGAEQAAEWVGRESGLRARCAFLLYGDRHPR